MAPSWSVGPASASITSTTTSARSMARLASITLSVSTCPDFDTAPGRRMPAVSTMRNCLRCHISSESTESRVVPGTSETIIRSSRSNRLTSDDLPAFGRPTIATAVSRCSGSWVTRGAFGTCARMASINSPTPTPCSALISTTASKPSLYSSRAPSRARRSSILLMARMIGAPLERAAEAMSWSPGTNPSLPSATITTRSASCNARRPRSTTRWCRGSLLAPNNPPVSVSVRERSSQVTGYVMMSRVVPAMGATMERLVPVNLLNRVDLPTFGRPTKTTAGDGLCDT